MQIPPPLPNRYRSLSSKALEVRNLVRVGERIVVKGSEPMLRNLPTTLNLHYHMSMSRLISNYTLSRHPPILSLVTPES